MERKDQKTPVPVGWVKSVVKIAPPITAVEVFDRS
jgi:hypothetical protein